MDYKSVYRKPDTLLAELIAEMVRLDRESMLPDGDMVHVGTHSWASEWVRRLTAAGYVAEKRNLGRLK